MFAVIRTGGKQYRVAKNDVLKIEKIPGEVGDTVSLGEVLAVDDGKAKSVGAPLVDGASVAAEVLDQRKDKKVHIFKKKRRHNYRRLKGHRQEITVLRVTDILTGGKKATTAKKAAPKSDETPKGEAQAAEEKPAAEAAAQAAPAEKTETKGTTAKSGGAKKTSAKSTTAKSGAKSGGAKSGGTKAAASKSKSGSGKTPAAKSSTSKSTKKSEE